MSKDQKVLQNSRKNELLKEIFESSIDLTVNYGEIGIDTIFDEVVLKEIPVLKTIVSTYKIGKTIRERHFAKKLIVFLKEFHSKEIEQEKLDEFRSRFEEDEKYRDQVMEQIAVFNDRFDDIEKSKVLANLFRSHIHDKMNWACFIEMATCLDRLFPRVLIILKKFGTELNFKLPKGHELDSPDIHAILSAAAILSQERKDHYSFLGSIGHDLYLLGINPEPGE